MTILFPVTWVLLSPGTLTVFFVYSVIRVQLLFVPLPFVLSCLLTWPGATITLITENKENNTDYSKELGFENEVNYDLLRKDNRDDINLYREVTSANRKNELNYFEFDRPGYKQSLNKIITTKYNPFKILLKNHAGPIKNNYKLENIYDNVLKRYREDFLIASQKNTFGDHPHFLIKLFALEDDIERKLCYKEKLMEINRDFEMGLENLLNQP